MKQETNETKPHKGKTSKTKQTKHKNNKRGAREARAAKKNKAERKTRARSARSAAKTQFFALNMREITHFSDEKYVFPPFSTKIPQSLCLGRYKKMYQKSENT